MSCEATRFVSRHFDLSRCTAALEMLYYDIINTDWSRSRRFAG